MSNVVLTSSKAKPIQSPASSDECFSLTKSRNTGVYYVKQDFLCQTEFFSMEDNKQPSPRHIALVHQVRIVSMSIECHRHGMRMRSMNRAAAEWGRGMSTVSHKKLQFTTFFSHCHTINSFSLVTVAHCRHYPCVVLVNYCEHPAACSCSSAERSFLFMIMHRTAQCMFAEPCALRHLVMFVCWSEVSLSHVLIRRS